MTRHADGDNRPVFPLMRPALLALAARRAAAQYRRKRDLPGAVPGLYGQADQVIRARLAKAEALFEEARRERRPGYRPARHVQILAALLAEEAARQAGAPAARPHEAARRQAPARVPEPA